MNLLKEPTYTRLLIGFTIAIVLMVACTLVMRSCRLDKEERAIIHDDQVRHHVEMARMDSLINARESKRIADSTTSAKKQDSLKTEIKGYQAVVRKYRTVELRNQVAQLAPDSAETAVFARYDSAVTYRDSLIDHQDSLISELYADKKQTWENFTAEIDGLKGKVKLSEDYARSAEEKLGRFATELAEQIGKKKTITWVAVIEAVVIALMLAL